VGEKIRTLGGRVGRASWVVVGAGIIEFSLFELLGSALGCEKFPYGGLLT
jgi:hypothetical protein